MTMTQWVQKIRRMRLEEACGGWQERRLTQEEEARLPGRLSAGFGATWTAARRRRNWTGCSTSALGQVSARGAPVDEMLRTDALYRERYEESRRGSGPVSASLTPPEPAPAIPDLPRTPPAALREAGGT